MNLRIKRRRFGKLAIVSSVIAVLTKFTSRVFAQSEQLYGVTLSSTSSQTSNSVDAVTSSSRTLNSVVDAAIADTTPGIVLQSIDLANLTTQQPLTAEISASSVINRQDATEVVPKAIVIERSSDRITALTVLADNTFVISTVAETKDGDFSRLLFIEPPKKNEQKSPNKGLKVKKVKDPKYKYTTVESLLAITIKAKKDNQLLSVISLSGGGTPFELAFIDSNSGQIDASAETGLPGLSPQERLSNLAQSPEGKLYATNVGGQGGGVSLVELDLANRAVVTGRGKKIRLVGLSFNNKPLENDLASLVFSSSGQLFALADPNYEETNSLFIVDMKTGAMTLLRKFAVDKIVFART